MPGITNRCEHMKFVNWNWEQCKNKRKVKRDGKWYCCTHDPVRRAKKRAERDKRYETAYAAASAKVRRCALEAEACTGLSDADLRKMIAKQSRK